MISMSDEAEHWDLAQDYVGDIAQQDIYDALSDAMKRRDGSTRQTTLFEAVEGLLERHLTEQERAVLWEEYNKTYDYWARIR